MITPAHVSLRVKACAIAVAFFLPLAWVDHFGIARSLAQSAAPPIWTVPEIGALADDANGRLVRCGRDLVTATYAYIGPEVPDRANASPATISPAAIVTFTPGPRSLGSRCSEYSMNFRTTVRAQGR
jgi:hypothetical protein